MVLGGGGGNGTGIIDKLSNPSMFSLVTRPIGMFLPEGSRGRISWKVHSIAKRHQGSNMF